MNMSYYFIYILNVNYISYVAKGMIPCEYYANTKENFENHQSVKRYKYFRNTCRV